MLSPDTLQKLQALQDQSHKAYSEGGLLYTYVEAANQAHCRFESDAAHEKSPQLSEDELKELSRFLQISQGAYGLGQADSSFVVEAHGLLDRLRSDVSFDEVYASFEDGGTDMEATIHMARRSDNRYFCLELWWSID